MSKLLNLCMLLLILALICPTSMPVQASTEFDNTLLQFTGGGHVLGFSENGLYAAAGDHALKVEFVNGSMLQPLAEPAASGQNAAAPLDKVTYKNAWNGVDIEYTSTANGIAESTYYLNIPASVDSIRLRYNRPLSLDGQGNLVISFENGNMVESAPIAWQELKGIRRAVSANYVIYGEKEVGFTLADYQPGIPVVIDPTLIWNTFLGGSGGDDYGAAIATDSSGNIYVVGDSYATWGSPVRAFEGAGNRNAFVAKLNNSGVLLWSTFLGGSGEDEGSGIIVDAGGNVYVSGYSNATWGSPIQAHDPGGNFDAFLAKLNNATGALAWNTFLGGSSDDFGSAIAGDSGGNVYIGGASRASWGSPVQAHDPGSNNDAFAVKLNNNGAIQWNTFLGGSGDDRGYGIVVDSGGNVYVAGNSDDTWGSPVQAHDPGSNNDTFAARLNSSGGLTWNTFLGGSGDDYGNSVTVDAGGNVYVAGSSYDTWGSPQRAHDPGSNSDAFAARLNNSGGLIWNTFLGGSGDDDGDSITVDTGGNIYINGNSSTTWDYPLWAYSGGDDAFAAMLNSANGALGWNTFMGSSGGDYGGAIITDFSGNIYITGASYATWGSPVHAYTGAEDAFVVKILGDPPTITSVNPARGTQRQTLTVTITGTNLAGTTAVSFGEGITVSRFTANSNTQITANIVIAPNAKMGNRNVAVTTPAGRANKIDAFKVLGEESAANSPRGSGSIPATPPVAPVSLSNISVQGASLSNATVSPNTPVTVTANIANKSTVNGNKKITVYVNGEIETVQGVSLDSGSTSQLTFNVSRNEPGTYSVYVDGANAGSFTVDTFADPNIILYISGALLIFAFIIGVIFISRRRQVQ